MSEYIITIGRQYGSCGYDVGKLLAEKRGYDLYDKNLIKMAAQKIGLSEDALSKVDEHATNSLLYSIAVEYLTFHNPVNKINIPVNDKLYFAQVDLIKEIAEKENGAVIVGRCADNILADNKRVIKVFIVSNLEKRISLISNSCDLEYSKARDIVIKTDKKRANYYNYYTGEKWGKSDNYDLVISTDRIGVSGAVDLINDYIDHIKNT